MTCGASDVRNPIAVAMFALGVIAICFVVASADRVPSQSAPTNRKVNVVLSDGSIVAVDEDIAKQSQLSTDTGAQMAAQVTEEENARRSSGVTEGIKAAFEGWLTIMTFDLVDAAAGHTHPEYARNSRIRARHRPGPRLVGQLIGFVLWGWVALAVFGWVRRNYTRGSGVR
jgi:hypothetical protein